MSDTQLATTQNQAPALYDDLQCQLAALTTLGEVIATSGLIACKNKQQGTLIAFTCITERITPIQFARKYEIIDGKLSQKSASMLAEFRAKYGGDFEWLDDGTTKTQATLRMTYKGRTQDVSYTFAQALAAGLTKKDNWRNNCAEMLRARCSAKAVRMVCPEIGAGVYTPEEIADVQALGRVHRQAADNPPQSALETADVGELERILETREATANAYFVSRLWIAEGQTFRDAPAERAAKIIANPAPLLAKLDEIAKAKESVVNAEFTELDAKAAGATEGGAR